MILSRYLSINNKFLLSFIILLIEINRGDSQPYNDSPRTVPEEKINFFYQFPELVEHRAFVLKELKDRKDETWSFY